MRNPSSNRPKAAISSANTSVDAVVSLCKRRGFVYPCGEIYGGTRSAWDYGPLGVELKENIKREWWRAMVQSREDVVGLDSSVILPSAVWEASVTSRRSSTPSSSASPATSGIARTTCRRSTPSGPPRRATPSTPSTPTTWTWGWWPAQLRDEERVERAAHVHGLLKTHLGPVESEEGLHYLRPETAQGIFVNFANVVSSSRRKPPFGIGQIGKSFRNEITPGNFIFRTREFEQMEMEFFVPPGEDEEWHQTWIDLRMRGTSISGSTPTTCGCSSIPPRSSRTTPSGPSTSSTASVRRLRVGRARGHREPHRLRPHHAQHALRHGPVVLRPDHGGALDAVRHRAGGRREPLDDGLPDRRLHEDEAPNSKGGVDKRTVLRLDPGWRRSRSPCCRCPATPTSHPGQGARERPAPAVERRLRRRRAIGRRYRRQDEVGTPYCVTVDFDTLDDDAVTVRERDTMAQQRIALDQVRGYLVDRLA
jgi:glycyl-tRNA synthetase